MTTYRAADPSARIVMVDDEPANIKLLERILASAGYEHVVSTTDPAEAIPLFKDFRPDLVLLDLHMPKLDGFAVMDDLGELIPADEYLPILVLTADVTATSKHKALAGGAKDFLTKPLDTAEVLVRVANLLETRTLHMQLRRQNELLEERVDERTKMLWQTVNELEQAQKDLRLAQEETIDSLSLAAEFRDDETSRHIERMSRYCVIVAEGLGIPADRRELIRLAAKMHDIGKIGVPDAILLKPGKLSPEEYEIMKTHAQIGHDILRGATSELARTARLIAWTHHEKVDGTGYPRGLQGHGIPIEGRIAAVADVFDALTTDRVYRKAFTLPEAIDIMKEGRGTHFDADILDVFLDNLEKAIGIMQAA